MVIIIIDILNYIVLVLMLMIVMYDDDVLQNCRINIVPVMTYLWHMAIHGQVGNDYNNYIIPEYYDMLTYTYNELRKLLPMQ